MTGARDFTPGRGDRDRAGRSHPWADTAGGAASDPASQPIGAGAAPGGRARSAPPVPPRSSLARWLPALRLRYKLVALLSLAALLPVMIASWVAVSVVLRGLDRGLRDDTFRQLRVGVNLVLQKVRRLGDDTARLSTDRALADAMSNPDGRRTQPEVARAVHLVLRRERARMPGAARALVQVTDLSGRLIADNADRYYPAPAEPDAAASPIDDLGVGPDAPSVRAALAYERTITISRAGAGSRAGDLLVARAAAPVVDASYNLLGAVVVSLPLDGAFADEIKGALGTDVLIFSRVGDAVAPELSTFFDAMGVRRHGLLAPAGVAARAVTDRPVLAYHEIGGHDYAVGYAALTDLDGRDVGALAVAVDRAPLMDAKRAATRSLALGAAGAFVFALALGGVLSRRLTRPLSRLHRGAIAIARGDLDYEIQIAGTDEIGDLALAFSHMTRALKENQARLAARMREIVALHDAGRAVSAVIDLDQVLKKIVDSVARVFDARLCALWLVDPARDEGEPGAGDPDATGDGSPTPAEPDLAGHAPVALADGSRLRIAAARARRPDGGASARAGTLHGPRAAAHAAPLAPVAADVATTRAALHVDRFEDPEPPFAPGAPADADATAAGSSPAADLAAASAGRRRRRRAPTEDRDARRRAAARAAGITGSLLAVPLERKGHVVGVIIVGRSRSARPFTEADANLLATFADQAAAAIENARLYREVRAFNLELEHKVETRTAELTAINAELERALAELGEAQAQLILSERLAGLGLLVAGVAHEINSPSAAIRGSVDALGDNTARLAHASMQLAGLALTSAERERVVALATAAAPELSELPLASPVEIRRAVRARRSALARAGVAPDDAEDAARALAELGVASPAIAVADEITALIATAGDPGDAAGRARVLPAYVSEHVLLRRNARTIRNAITRIQRIVRSLKAYSHLDQAPARACADIHEGIDDTLIILDYVTRGVNVVRNYGELPPIPIYVDELNQVWTNLIQNAAHALGGRGQITIETAVCDAGVAVRIIDDGPGMTDDTRARIFEPFFTTKPKGEGTGLGLGIVRQIVQKHGGRIACESRPGRTCFEVWLPVEPAAADPDGRAGASPGGAGGSGASA